jgi:hypothetical protein
VYFELSRHGDFVAAIGCAVAYLMVFAGLMLVDAEGPRNVKLRYQYLWTD